MLKMETVNTTTIICVRTKQKKQKKQLYVYVLVGIEWKKINLCNVVIAGPYFISPMWY